MADAQVPWGVEALGGAITAPAWKTPKVGTWSRPNKMIPPIAQRRRVSKRAGSTAVEVKAATPCTCRNHARWRT